MDRYYLDELGWLWAVRDLKPPYSIQVMLFQGVDNNLDYCWTHDRSLTKPESDWEEILPDKARAIFQMYYDDAIKRVGKAT